MANDIHQGCALNISFTPNGFILNYGVDRNIALAIQHNATARSLLEFPLVVTGSKVDTHVLPTSNGLFGGTNRVLWELRFNKASIWDSGPLNDTECYQNLGKYPQHCSQAQLVAFGPSHVRHCTNLLHQSLICHADKTIEVVNEGINGMRGFRTEYRCKDWDQLVQWTIKQQRRQHVEQIVRR